MSNYNFDHGYACILHVPVTLPSCIIIIIVLDLYILGAAFGLEEVTPKLKTMVTSRQTLSVTASNQILGDGWPGVRKSLVVVFKYGENGVPTTKSVGEDSTLQIP